MIHRRVSLYFSTVAFAAASIFAGTCTAGWSQGSNTVNSKVSEYSKDPDAQKISISLLGLAHENKDSRRAIASPAAGAIAKSEKGDALMVEVICKSLNDRVLKKFALPGVEVKDYYPEYNRVYVAVSDLGELDEIAKIPDVGMIVPVYKPHTAFSGIADGRADRAMGSTGLIDQGITGAGQTVGILSDSFAHTTGTRDENTFPAFALAGTLTGAKNQDSGDLPPTVNLLRDDQFGEDGDSLPGEDEGAAMAELVHDVAPGAAIAFHTASGGEAVFADGINRLRTEAGAKIIVDDVIYLREPMYQDGIVAKAAATAVSKGVSYFSAAGNNGDLGIKSNYVDVNSAVDDTANPPSGNDLHDWGSGQGFLPIHIPANSPGAIVVLQWNQPWYSVNPRYPSNHAGSQIDLDLYLTAAPTAASLANPIAISRDAQGLSRVPLGDPVEILQLPAGGGSGETVFLAVDHYQGSEGNIPQGRQKLEFRIVFFTNGSPLEVQGFGIGGNQVGPTIYGHALATGAIAVGAVPWWESPFFKPSIDPFIPSGNRNPALNGPGTIDPEIFSSRGGNITVPFNSSGYLSYRPRTVFAPQISAPDGDSTTFFGESDSTLPPGVGGVGGEPDGFPNFFGTSAAAPNAAAVAALMKQKTPTLKPSDILKRMQQTALDVNGYRAAFGTDDVSGAGLIDAEAAVLGSSTPRFPNLAFTTPAGWSGGLVVNQTVGSRGDASSFSVESDTYVNFAVINNGDLPANLTTEARLVVDGITVQTLTIPTLARTEVATFTDINIGHLAAGSHTIQVVLDPTNQLVETNEGDNTATKVIIATAEPNLTFIQPAGWSSEVVVNQSPGSTNDTAKMDNTQNVYVNYTIKNTGAQDINSSFFTDLFVDGGFRDKMTLSGLAAGATQARLNVNIGMLSPGVHRIDILTDNGYVIAESNESDNMVSKFITIGAAPSNDNLANAAIVDACTLSISGSTDFATKEAGEPFHAGNRGGSSVWYKFTTPPSDRPVRFTIDTIGSDFNTLLGLYKLANPAGPVNYANLQFVASSDDIQPAVNTASSITLEAAGNTTFYIALDGYNGAQGNFVLNFSLGITNDDFANALLLPGVSGTTETINFCATKETCEPNHAGNAGGHSLWFKWVAPQTGTGLFTTAGSRVDTLLGVYTLQGNTLCDGLTSIAQNDDLSVSDQDSYVTFNISQGATYYVAVDGKNGVTGNITLSWSAGPSNDFFGSPTDLPSTTNSQCGVLSTNIGATKEPGEPVFIGNTGGSSVWFRWTAPEKLDPTNGDVLTSYPMTFDTIGSNFDTIMAIYQGTSINTLNLLGLNDDVNPARNSRMKTSRVSFNAFPNQTYYIMVDGKNGVQGSILLNWDDSFAPVNDFLTSPIFFTELQAGCVDSVTIETSGTTKGAAKEPGSTGPEPNHAGQIGKRSVWYRLTLPENSGCADMVIRTIRIKVTATTPGFDPVVAVYTGSQTDVSGLTSVAFQDDITPGSNTNVDMSFLAGPGTYLIAVDGKFCSSGNFDLTIENSATSAFGPAAP